MPDATWKQRERKVAKALNGQRTGATGRQGPDVINAWLCCEVKHRRKLPQWLRDALAKIRHQAGSNRLGVLVLHEHARHDSIVCLSLSDFRAWFGGEQCHDHAPSASIPPGQR